MPEPPADDGNEPQEPTPEASNGAKDEADDVHAREGDAGSASPEGLVQLPMRVSPALDLSSILNLPDFSNLVRPLLPDLQRVLNLPQFANVIPQMNLAGRLIPALELSGLVPKIDYASLFPKIELVGPKFDFSAVLPKITFPDFAPGFTALLERLREKLPPNWPHGIDIDQVVTVIQDDGLPLVWVPRADIVTKVLRSPDRAARVEVLLGHPAELIEDCREVLNVVSHETLAGQLPLAKKAVDALEAGYHEAAQALAVVVTETAVARAISGKYQDVKKQVLFDPELVPYTQLRLRAALAPIGPFYTTWYASSGAPAPEALSRHVTVHQADHSHYTPGNATVAVLLATSVLRALQELQELAEATENEQTA